MRNSQSASVKKSPQAAAKSSSLDGKMISPFSEKTISRESKGEKPGSRDSKDGSRRGSGRAEEKPVEQPTSQYYSIYFENISIFWMHTCLHWLLKTRYIFAVTSC